MPDGTHVLAGNPKCFLLLSDNGVDAVMPNRLGVALITQPTEGKSPMRPIDGPIAGSSLLGNTRFIGCRVVFGKVIAWMRRNHAEMRIASRYGEQCWDDAIERKLTDELMDLRFGRR